MKKIINMKDFKEVGKFGVTALRLEKMIQRAKRADRAAFRGILDKVHERAPLPGDEISPENR
ncbi:hypothetical protein VU01_10257 [Candidatus Electrothrix marina]|uniref:Uncharacterized protein n=1 Tax=Candidatus Electrothrix marina TaxID=1859130 RepID=A0A444JGP4_9BACT|nr:hypothetical protein VU01_10257 [Candidatus Electrothrix marina]